MAFGIPNQEQYKRFQETLGAKNYLNGGDIPEGGSVTLRIVPWIFHKSPTAFVPHLEGWSSVIDPKSRKEIKSPHRFSIGETIPDDIPWQVGTYMGKATSGAPRNAVVFLAYNHRSHNIQCCSFNQFGFLTNFDLFFKEVEGNDFYVENITKHDIIVRKGTDGKLSVSLKPSSEPELSDEIKEALSQMLFSYELYMQGADPFNPDPRQNLTWKEVELVLNGGATEAPVATNKNTTTEKTTTKAAKTEAKKSEEVKMPKWRAMETPKGAILGEQDLATLTNFKASLEKKAAKEANKETLSSELYLSVCYGINHFEDAEKVEENLSEEDTEI